jgi:formylglycine-generating enzyme required for sulfatase activity
MSVGLKRTGVPVSAALLVVAVWASLRLSRKAEAGEPLLSAPEVHVPERLEGFRADAFFLPDDDLLGFVRVPGGPFLMGSDPGLDPMAYDVERWSRAEPQGAVDVETFYVGRLEVTVAQFLAFVRATGFRTVDAALRERLDHPMGGVSWTGAVTYAGWLEEGLRAWPGTPPELGALLDEGWHVTLPTEAQWEKAARGSDGRIYPWGDKPRPERAVFRATGPAPVGSRPCPECPYGLSDMSGNVWEWTRSLFQPYPYDPSDDADDLTIQVRWVLRGGSYADSERHVRASMRAGAEPGLREPTIGFRVVIAKN